MATTITVDRVEAVTSQGGKPYHKLYSKEGDTYSIWTKSIADKFMLEVGNRVTIDYTESNGYKTIRSMPKHDTISDAITEAVNAPTSDKNSYRVSELVCVKDLFICLYSAQQIKLNSMPESIGKEMAEELYTAEQFMMKAVELVSYAKLELNK